MLNLLNLTLNLLRTNKNELKQKVGRDEFAVLERRVSLLEARLK